MKDLASSERVYQLDVAGLPTDFPPLASLNGPSDNLPGEPTPFIGRHEELARLLSALSERRLVTLTGLGGIGKTRLALRAAIELRRDPDVQDVWFVDLSEVTDAALVPRLVAEAAGVRFGVDDPAEVLARDFGQRATVLVLDNLERVLGCASFLAGLLGAVPGLRMLATSREPLGVRAEQVVPVPAMRVPASPAGSATASVVSCESVELFWDRARAADPDLVLTDENAETVAAICVRLEGHPLALELAASRLTVLTPSELLRRLDTVLSVLTGGSADMPARHRTLRATIEWSVSALSLDERDLLVAMAVLPGPADLEMIEGVCARERDVLSTLDSLVQRSLVRRIDEPGFKRFSLFGSVREFVEERAGDRDDLRRAHATYVSELFSRPRSTFADIGLVERELPHLRAALTYLRSVGDHEQEVALLISTDDGLLHAGHVADVLQLCEHALDVSADPAHRAHLLTLLGMALENTGRTRDYRDAYAQALVEVRRCGDLALHANVVVIGLSGARTRVELDARRREYESLRSALATAWRAAMDDETANQMAASLRFCDATAAEGAARAHLGSEMDAMHRVRWARVLHDTGHHDLARDALVPTQRPDAFRGIRVWELRGAVEIARSHLYRDEVDRARALLHEAVDGYLEIGATPHEAFLMLAEAEHRATEPSAAKKTLDRALRHVQAVTPETAQILWRRALTHLELANHHDALLDIAEARRALQGEDRYLVEILGCMAVEATALAAEDPGRAAKLLGSIAAHRSSWILPFDLDANIRDLTTHLVRTNPKDLDTGRQSQPMQLL